MSVVSRIAARVIAVLPTDWRGPAGRRFSRTTQIISDTVRELAPDAAEVPELIAEGAKRLAVGTVSQAHSEVMRNYAEEEKARIDAAFAQRTLEDRVRQERAKAEQEEVQLSLLRSKELLARLELAEKLKSMGLGLVRDVQGNLDIVRTTSDVLAAAQDKLLDAKEISSALDESSSSGHTEKLE